MWDGDWAERVCAITPVLLRRLRMARLSEADAQDACQAAWLALLLRPDALRDHDRLTAWLGTTAWRQAMKMITRLISTNCVWKWSSSQLGSIQGIPRSIVCRPVTR